MTIKLELTPKELERLVEIGIMSEWLMTAYDTQTEPEKEPYLNLIQKIYQTAAENGHKHIDIFESDFYEPDMDWEESTLAKKCIDEFEQQTFWEELVRALAEKEAQMEIGAKAKISSEKQFEVFSRHAEKIAKEFEANGIKNLVLKRK